MIIELIAFTAGAYVGCKYTEKTKWVLSHLKKIKNPLKRTEIIKSGDKYVLRNISWGGTEYIDKRNLYPWSYLQNDCLGTLEEIQELAKRFKDDGKVVEVL